MYTLNLYRQKNKTNHRANHIPTTNEHVFDYNAFRAIAGMKLAEVMIVFKYTINLIQSTEGHGFGGVAAQ